ncbi:MAG TPA: tRNA uridine-5-carboxymethylaminomethyl(34) synthesis GTPase MnmE [Ignavibacteriaceae bacterium]|nr:tRNA uridine-5-carboxymethylaminomethyl(34) synthesis GTPase MnmE [Ignavibacteriaceae bacterium]
MSTSLNEDTIAAVATPFGNGAISIIRISGPESFLLVDKIFDGKKKIADAATHTIHYGKIIDDHKNFIDDVLVSVFRMPNSYTGEDSVEISTHGNPLISKKIIELLSQQNVRLAEPGEFTKRAFLNNKIDLSQAEAVADIINARTEASLKGARNQLDGILSQKVNELRNLLINASSFIELELDFAEEDIEFLNKNDLLKRIEKITFEIDRLISTYSFGKVIRDGVNVSLVGAPNVGKSSILNYIVKESRAIVSDIPGTTRDVIREDVSIGGILFRLHDTAGIRPSIDEIEKEGIFRSQEAIKNSDIILLIGDVEQGISPKLLDNVNSIAGLGKTIKLINKIDLTHNKIFDKEYICVSALTGQGMESLFNKLIEFSVGSSVYSEKSAVVSSLRHFLCLKNAKESLQKAVDSINLGLSGEFIAVDLRNAESNLGEIIGEVTSEDILNNIFMKFCIGK